MACPLDVEEIDYIKRTWSIAASNIHQCGEMVFYKFFEKYPSYIIFFTKFKDSSLVQLKVRLFKARQCAKAEHFTPQNSPAFRKHGYLIMCQIGESVKQLGTPEGWDNIKKSWHDHGEMHIPLKVKKVQFMVSLSRARRDLLETFLMFLAISRCGR